MSTERCTPEFKEEAVKQVVERGYCVPDVASRLGVSAHSLYKWVKAVWPDRSEQQSKELLEAKSEILRLRAQIVLQPNPPHSHLGGISPEAFERASA